MNWPNEMLLSRAGAKQRWEEMDSMPEIVGAEAFEIFGDKNVKENIKALVDQINGVMGKIDENSSKNERFEADCEVGEWLFYILSFKLTSEWFRPIFFAAPDIRPSTDRFWIGLQCKLLEQATYRRWKYPGEEKPSRDRFYDNTWRIWLKTLWWIYYIAWQGDENSFQDLRVFMDCAEQTRKVVASIGSDAISQVLERAGSGFDIPRLRYFFRHLDDFKSRLREGITIPKVVKFVLKMDVARKYTLCSGIFPLNGIGVSNNLTERDYWNDVLKHVLREPLP